MRERLDRGFHYWRWRAVAAWIVIFSLLVAWELDIARNNAASAKHTTSNLAALVHHNRQLAKQANRTARDQANTITLLCDRAYLLDGVVLDMLAFGRSFKKFNGYSDFSRDLETTHRELVYQITDPKSPCAR